MTVLVSINDFDSYFFAKSFYFNDDLNLDQYPKFISTLSGNQVLAYNKTFFTKFTIISDCENAKICSKMVNHPPELFIMDFYDFPFDINDKEKFAEIKLFSTDHPTLFLGRCEDSVIDNYQYKIDSSNDDSFYAFQFRGKTISSKYLSNSP